MGRIRARWCNRGTAHRSSQLIAGTIGQAGPRRLVGQKRCRRTRKRPQSAGVRRSRSLHRLRVGDAKGRASRRRTREESEAGPLKESGFEAATTLPSAWGRPMLGMTVPHPFVVESCHRRFRESRGFTCWGERGCRHPAPSSPADSDARTPGILVVDADRSRHNENRTPQKRIRRHRTRRRGREPCRPDR